VTKNNNRKLILSLSSDNLPGCSRVRLWEEHLATLGFGGLITPRRNHAFQAQASGQAFGDNLVITFERTASTYQRREIDCRADLGKSLALMVLLEGAATVEQYGRRTSLSPGDCCLLHAGAPFCAENDDCQAIALLYDREIAAHWLPDPKSVCAVPLSHDTPWGHALSTALVALAADSPPTLAVPPDAVVNQINCLLALSAALPPRATGTYRASVFLRVYQILRLHARTPGFGPVECADLCGISLRSLHTAFAHRDTTFGRELKIIRLQTAQNYLGDAKFDGKTIAEIAAMCGFTHTSHFITCFGKAFGISPSKYRKTRRLLPP